MPRIADDRRDERLLPDDEERGCDVYIDPTYACMEMQAACC